MLLYKPRNFIPFLFGLGEEGILSDMGNNWTKDHVHYYSNILDQNTAASSWVGPFHAVSDIIKAGMEGETSTDMNVTDQISLEAKEIKNTIMEGAMAFPRWSQSNQLIVIQTGMFRSLISVQTG